jgi:hypothetical protein
MIDANTVEPMPQPDSDASFWSQRVELQHVLHFARYRRASPWAVLGNILRRGVACVEPSVVLPAIVGSVASVNLYTASAGKSGQGKGAADGAGFDAIRFVDEDNVEIHTARPNIGSGEGLARLFKGHSEDEREVQRAHLIVPEVGTLAALAGRQGATLSAELLKAFSGEPLGFTNAHKDTNTAIPAHSYRLCLGVGVQPENAGFFLSRTKDGFPQRFVWMPTSDLGAPASPPDPVEPIDITVPRFDGQRYIVAVPNQVAEQIDHHRFRCLIEADDVDPLDGHLMLTRLKVGFALALLAGRRDVDIDDWELAGQVIDVSTCVRTGIQAVVDERGRRDNRTKAFEAADREAIVAARLTEETEKRVAKAITNKLKRAGSATRRELLQSCASQIRSDFMPVFSMFLDKEFIVKCDEGEGQADRYRLAT